MTGDTPATDQAVPGDGSSARASARPELKDPAYEIFIAGLSILSIVNLVLLYVIQDSVLDTVLDLMNGLLSTILFLDFCNRMWTAQSRSDYFLRGFGWADLFASLPLPQLKILRVFRLARVYRLLRAYGARNIGRSLLKERAGSALLSLLFVAILVLEFGSLWMLRLESRSPDANITSASDAVWYIIVTISTVGYGDQYPVTNQGRVLGAIIIVLGVAIFGTLTGYLANLFLAPRGTEQKDGAAEPSPAPSPGSVIDDRLARLARAAELRDSGVLTQAEFEATKAEILSG